MMEEHGAADRRSEHNTTDGPRPPHGKQGRGPLVAFIFSLVIVQGLTINLMPMLFGIAKSQFGADKLQQGQLQSLFLAGGIVALFVSGYVTEYLRAKRSGLLAVVFIGVGSLQLGFATTYLQMLLAAAVTGLGNMWILAAYSAVITAHFADIRQRMFMWATAAFAGSAAISTTLFGYLLDTVPNWHLIFLGFGAVVLTWFGVFFLIAGKKLHVISGWGWSCDSESVCRPGGLTARLHAAGEFLASGLFNRWTFWLLGLLVVLDVLAAGNIISWTGRFFQEEHGVSEYQVGLMISASSAGVFIGRLLMGTFISGRFSDRTVLGSCYAAGILMYVLILLVPSYRLGLVLMFLNGAFIAAQAPTMYAIASAKFGDRAATAIPLMDAIGVSGGCMGPTVVGALARQYGLYAVLWFIPALGTLLVLIVFTWQLIDRRRGDDTLARL